MAEKDTTIKINVDLNASSESIAKIGKDLSGGMDAGIAASLKTLREKEKQITSNTNSIYYKYGANHLQSRAVVSDLAKTRKSINTIEVGEKLKEKQELDVDYKKNRNEAMYGDEAKAKRNEKHDLDVEYKKNRNTAQELRAKEKADSKQSSYFNIPVFSQMLTHLKSVDETGKKSLLSLGSIGSILSSAGRAIGPVGFALGGVAALVAGALKAVSAASNADLGYASTSFGSGFSTGEIASLGGGEVYGDVGRNLASSISQNKLLLSPNNRLRQAQLNELVTNTIQQFGGYKDFNDLRFITSKMTQKEVYARLISDIGKTKNQAAALSIGGALGLSDETVLGIQTIGARNVLQKTQEQGAQNKNLNNLTAESFNQASTISSLAAKINLWLIPAIINLTKTFTTLNASTPKTNPYNPISTQLGIGGGAWHPGNFLYHPNSGTTPAGNSPKGIN